MPRGCGKMSCGAHNRVRICSMKTSLRIVLATVLCSLFVSGSLEAADKKRAASGSTEGVFLGIDSGDYQHFLIRDKQGKQQSFVILKPDRSLKSYLGNPGALKARRVRVHWKMETVPEAGEQMKTVVKVEERTID